MNNYEDWAQLVAKKLKGEADLIAAIENEELDDAGATEAFTRAVLEPFLPENFGIGSGRIADAFGNYSDHLDIVIYNRDFPRIGMRGAQKAYLYESVLAAFAVRAKFVRKTFFEAMNACASMAELSANIDKTVLVRLAKKNGLTLGPNKKFIHRDPLHTERFDLIGRPPAFVFGFSGMKFSYKQLQENIELWLDQRQQNDSKTEMKALPAVIATQGCFAWRNAAPLALSNREMLGIGNDDAPIRLVILQMLYLLNRRLNVTADGYGLKPNLKAYLSQFAPPRFEVGAGNVDEVADLKNAAGGKASSFVEQTRSSQYVPAEDRATPPPKPIAAEPPPAAAAPAPKPVAETPKPVIPEPVATAPAAKAEVFDQPSSFASAPTPPQEAPAKPAPATPAPEPAAEAAVFDKPSPFASAPTPPQEAPAKPAAAAPAPEPAAEAAVFDKPSPFASAPIPPQETEDKPAPARASLGSPLGSAPIPMDNQSSADKSPPSPPLGSAPIPPMQPAASIIPPRPPVDIELDFSADAGDPAPAPVAQAADDLEQEEEDEFSQTVVIPPPNAAEKKTEPPRNSTDAFIARVKEQLSTSEFKPESEQDFTSTIPQ